MGYHQQAKIYWKGSGGNKKSLQTKATSFPVIEGDDELSMGAIGTLLAALLPYTDCTQDYIFRSTKYTYTEAFPADANLDIKAVVYFKHPTNGKVHHIELPAPVSTMFELQGKGERVTSVALSAIVGAISTAYGISFIPLWGKKIQRG